MLLQELSRSRVSDALREMERLEDQLSRLSVGTRGSASNDYPPMNVWTSDTDILIKAEVPGVDPLDLELTVEEHILKVWGIRQPDELGKDENYRRRERDYGQFMREYPLPHKVDIEGVKAAFNDGVLRITLPKDFNGHPQKIEIHPDDQNVEAGVER